MLLHHDARDYESAARQAADQARDKLGRLIEDGRARAAVVIEAVRSTQPCDRLIRESALRFLPSDAGVALEIDGSPHELHRKAIEQAVNRAGLPHAYARFLLCPERAEWGRQLLAQNLSELYGHGSRTGDDDLVLLRSVEQQVRGFLSSRYRRLDSRPMLDAFASACASVGAVPFTGYALDTKVAIKAIVPSVFEPVANEPLAVGIVLETSDFGDGALALRSFVLRLYCTNTAILEQCLRQVHLGRRLDESYVFSDRTYSLDTRAMASAIGDVVRAQLSSTKLDHLQDLVRRADAEEITPFEVETFLKKHLDKQDAQAVKDAFASADIVNLPPGSSRWRLSNAISWVAGEATSDERRIELMKVAGEALPRGA